MLSLTQAKLVLRIDNEYNDEYIQSLLYAIPQYIEASTGMSLQDQPSDPLVDTVSGFILTLWYFADHADDAKLNRTIDSLLHCIKLKANKLARERAAE